MGTDHYGHIRSFVSWIILFINGANTNRLPYVRFGVMFIRETCAPQVIQNPSRAKRTSLEFTHLVPPKICSCQKFDRNLSKLTPTKVAADSETAREQVRFVGATP